MLSLITDSTIEWSRWQFAMTAIYHYLFVPLTVGLSLIIAIMESIWYRSGNDEWLAATKFWMRLFGVNFAIGVATGLILEFQFGTNWSNYSWFVGDIFGAPLAIEGIVAFFLEATFIAVMFWGWRKVSKEFHLLSTWLVFVGTNLSALWILIANGWMQNPVGIFFNPDSMRNEMIDFWSVALSPLAINKFFHTVTSAYSLSAAFVLGVSFWFIYKRREQRFAEKSILVASIFGIVAMTLTMITGDKSGQEVARHQPMKFAAMEGLYDGESRASLTIVGDIKIPSALSILAYRNAEAFIPGVKDIERGYKSYSGEDVLPLAERVRRGKLAVEALALYKQKEVTLNRDSIKNIININYNHFGYASIDGIDDITPNISLVFYSFRVMVGLGLILLLLYLISIVQYFRRALNSRALSIFAILSVPLAYIASQCGWIVSEVGRQPWVVQDLMTTREGATNIASYYVIATFIIFAIMFTVLLFAELKIMFNQIKRGVE